MEKSHPPNTGLTTEEEIATLPRFARIAFAARCARRVEALLFNDCWPNAPEEHVRSVAVAITAAESAASSASETGAVAADVTEINTADALISAANGARAAARAAHAADATDPPVHASAYAAEAAADAAEAASSAGPEAAARAAASAVRAAAGSVFEDSAAAKVAMRRDLELLRSAAEREKWTDKTPVPPEFFGPLWPDGEPTGWLEEKADGGQPRHVLKLEISVPRGMSGAASREFNEKVIAFLAALSAVDASMGGTGLQILNDASHELVEVESEEPTPVGGGGR